MGETHRAAAGGVAVLSCAAVAGVSAVVVPDHPFSFSAAVFVWFVAHRFACWPDIDIRWWCPGGHRGWTHWLVSCVLVSLFFGVLCVGVGYGIVWFEDSRSSPHTWVWFERRIMPYAWLAALLVMWGVLVGTVSHVLSDACTKSGVPLWGPWDREPRWIVRKEWRFRTEEDGVGDLRARRLSHVVTWVVCAAVTVPYWWPVLGPIILRVLYGNTSA